MLKDKLKELRKEKGLTQTQLSEQLEIPQTTYAGYETGKHEPDFKTLIKIADFYKTSTDYLLGRIK